MSLELRKDVIKWQENKEKEAVDSENFEEAARRRDIIKALTYRYSLPEKEKLEVFWNSPEKEKIENREREKNVELIKILSVEKEFEKEFEKYFLKENLFNRLGMTEEDNVNMTKSIEFLVDKKMDTSENLKKLRTINYGSNYIEIWWVKRARENLKAEPDGKDIFKHGDEIYFKFNTWKKQNKSLAKQGMEIPWKDNFTRALQALPWDFSQANWYTGANILWTILNLSMSGWCYSGGELFDEGEYGYTRSSSERGGSYAWEFKFDKDGGGLGWLPKDAAFVIRPILK